MGVAAGARELSSFARIDYEDCCVVEAPGARRRTAEAWAREMLEGAPAATRAKPWSVWLALGLKLGPLYSERRVLGWELRRRSDDFVVLAAESRLGLSAEVLIERRPRALMASTFLQQHNPIARMIWAGTAPGHRQTLRRLLAAAVRRSG